jgi:hypothetical protein
VSDHKELSGEKMYKLPGGEIVPVISLRDYFAAAAIPTARDHLIGLGIYTTKIGADDVAYMAYDFADAMLEARDQDTPTDL